MTLDAHKNFAISTVATAPSPATSGTSLVVAAGEGALFPTAPFNAVIWPAGAQPRANNAEVVRVTVKSTDTFTITRSQEGTSARTVVLGDQIAATITAKTLTDVEVIICTTANRPTSNRWDGQQIYDTDLNKPLWWDGSAWRDAAAQTV